MRHEIRVGQSVEVGPASVALDSLSQVELVGFDGKRTAFLTANLRVNGESVAVREGSLLSSDGSEFRVVRVVEKAGIGLVRLVPADEWGRFGASVDAFKNSASPFAPGMLFLNAGVRSVDDVLSRLDDHPDVVGEIADTLRPASKMLGAALSTLQRNGASAALLAFCERYLAICNQVLETAETSTQERIL